ncbi:MAG: glycosyltransferase family 9 protein [Phycisphaerales bacterium]|jgi:lipopolysaccharide heptosyltransferase I
MTNEPKSILIIKPSALGDIIQALPSLAALRKSFPAAEIRWLVRTEFAPLINNHSHLTEAILFDRKFLGKAWKNPKALAALVSLIFKLRKYKFDLVLDLQGLFRTAVLGWLSGCKVRAGMAGAREFGHVFYNRRVKQDKSCIHLADYYLKIAAAGGTKTGDVEFILGESNPAASSGAKRLLDSSDVSGSKYAVFVPGSAHADKCWATENFAELADKITERYGLSIIAVGTSGESTLAEQINSKAETEVINLAGKTDIPVLVELLRTAKLVISNDTGPGHIAAAFGMPIVLIFGRSNPSRVMPYGRDECVAAIEPMTRGFKADSTDPKHSIGNITVDEVWQKVLGQMD